MVQASAGSSMPGMAVRRAAVAGVALGQVDAHLAADVGHRLGHDLGAAAAGRLRECGRGQRYGDTAGRCGVGRDARDGGRCGGCDNV